MPDSLWFQVEQEIATLLLDKLENGQLSPERAVEIAKFVVHTIPHHLTDQEMLVIIPKLDDQFYELAALVHKHLSPKIETETQQKLATATRELHYYLQKKHGQSSS